ncbi:MAG: hypothetical protein KatS3mg108_2606 [Isosphaeraceae bacterium]|jgi:predicted nucleotidyltransferase component of viral defense system|nr:MAG: hypothetical protein KatS3mg108_2606 [Isosphaeraceae bacterium]
MRLFEHEDFEQLLLAAAEHFGSSGLSASAIEKDYYVTEALRLIAQAYGPKVIFKGGTSLSKGWGLIQRFSEDIDIFLDPEAYTPKLGKRPIDRELEKLRDTVAAHPGLHLVVEDSRKIGGIGRDDHFEYRQLFPGSLRPRVLVEAGTASGRQPTEDLQLDSYAAAFLRETGNSVGAEDEAPFTMRLLHFRRTFVEKLFTIHGKIEQYLKGGKPLGTYARHYYDLYRLAQRDEVRAMLNSREYDELRIDYDRLSRAHFPKYYLPPEGMRFNESAAIFPSGALKDMVAREYRAQCELLCFGGYPEWEEVERCLVGLQNLL